MNIWIIINLQKSSIASQTFKDFIVTQNVGKIASEVGMEYIATKAIYMPHIYNPKQKKNDFGYNHSHQ